MPIALTIALFCAGIAIIIKCSDLFVDAASWVSDATGVSKVVIGATLVSFATTSPEYFVSTIAIIKGYTDLSIGNAVGSLSANLGVAFAILALFTPGLVRDRLYGAKGLIMTASTAVLLIFCLNGTVSAPEGAILLLLFAFSIFINIRYSKEGEDPGERARPAPREIRVNVAKFVGGAAGIIFGSNLIVDNGKLIATHMGVSEAVIGLTFVAIGTSIPEIATSIAAAIKKQPALSIGNIVGANIIDATLILATGSFISKGALTVSKTTIGIDLPVTLLLMVLAVLPSALGKKTYRWQGAAMAAVYAAFLVFTVL